MRKVLLADQVYEYTASNGVSYAIEPEEFDIRETKRGGHHFTDNLILVANDIKSLCSKAR